MLDDDFSSFVDYYTKYNKKYNKYNVFVRIKSVTKL